MDHIQDRPRVIVFFSCINYFLSEPLANYEKPFSSAEMKTNLVTRSDQEVDTYIKPWSHAVDLPWKYISFIYFLSSPWKEKVRCGDMTSKKQFTLAAEYIMKSLNWNEKDTGNNWEFLSKFCISDVITYSDSLRTGKKYETANEQEISRVSTKKKQSIKKPARGEN